WPAAPRGADHEVLLADPLRRDERRGRGQREVREHRQLVRRLDRVVEVGADDLAGQVDRARPLAEEGRAVLLPLAEARGVALAISVLARCDQQEGDLAGVVAARGRPGEAARLAGAAEAW